MHDDFRAAMELAYGGGNWFKFPRLLLARLDPRDVVFLAYLINVAERVGAEARRDGWFYCLQEDCTREIYFTPDVQKRALKALRDAGLVAWERRGMPARRWLRIDYRRLHGMCQDARETLVGANLLPQVGAETARHVGGKTARHSGDSGQENTSRSRKAAPGRCDGVCRGETEEAQINQKAAAMPFFNEAQTKKPTSPSPEDLEHAAHLRTALVAARRTAGPYTKAKWADAFRLLRTKDAIPPDRITRALAWLLANVTGQYTPRVFNAQDFRAKFLKIEDAMHRACPAADIKPSEDAWGLLDELGLIWPAGTDRDALAAGIEVSLQNYDRIVAGLKKVIRQSTQPFINEAAARLLHDLGSWDVFVRNWWADVHRMACRWDRWQGQVMSCILTPHARQFVRWGENSMKAYAAQPGLFHTLMQEAGL